MARISRTGTTDSTGVASTTVTGSGGGRLKFISRNGGLWSNSCEVDDLIFYDNATESNHNDKWYIRLPNITTMTRESDGTVIEWTGTYSHVECENGRYYNVPTVIEFDVIEQVNARIQYYSGSATNVEKSYSLTQNGHYKCINTLTSQKIYCGDDLLYEATSTFPQYYFAFLSNVNGSVERMIKFSNFKVYPIFSAPKHYTPIALSSSASIIQTGESATLTAELTNVLGEKVAQKSVNFIEKSVQLFKDNATTSSHNDTRWTTWTSAPPTITRKAEYTSIEQQTSGTTSYSIFPFSDLNPKIIEYDFYKTDGALNEIIGQLRNSSRSVLRQFALSSWTGTSLNTWYHIKLDFENKLIYCDDKSIAMNNIDPSHLYLACYSTTTEVRYKNFKVIGDKTVTETTNSQGVATTTITSQGTGERQITAQADNTESETITITDNLFYDSLTSASGKWTIPSGVTSSYSSEGWKVSANGYKQVKLTDKLTEPCSVEITIADYNDTTSDASVILYAYTNGETTPNQLILINNKSTSMNVLGTTLNRPVVKGATYKVEYTTSTIKVYENGELLGSASSNVGLPTRFEFHIGSGGRYAVYKDLKVSKL